MSAVRKKRLSRLLLWCLLFSAAVHFVALLFIGGLLARRLLTAQTLPQQPVLVTLSTVHRMQRHTRPAPARHPVDRVRPAPPKTPPHRVTAAPPARVTPPHIRHARHLPAPKTHALTQADLDAQTRMFEKTIARAKAANNPLAGIANATIAPEAPRTTSFNVRANLPASEASGELFPLKRWKHDGYDYYYVRYDVVYRDGETESGDVPWPIRFPANHDPLSYGIHRVPLPGPPGDYVVPDDVSLMPLVKNCYDHRYAYCPIARESGD